MNTTHARGKVVGAARGAVVAGAAAAARRALTMLILAALSLGAVLLAPSPAIAHAARLAMHVSENPVHFGPLETKKTIEVTWSPPEIQVEVLVKHSDGFVNILPAQVSPYGGWQPVPVDIKVGETLTIWVRSYSPEEQTPTVEITTVQPIVVCTICGGPTPQPPRGDISAPFTPKPGPPGPY